MLQFEFNTTAVNLKSPAAVTADTYGELFDISDYKGQGLLILNTGAGTSDTGVTPSLACGLYSCEDSDGSFAAVSSAVFTARATAASHEGIGVDLRACDRYCKLYFNITGSGGSYTCSASALMHDGGY